MRDTVTLTGAVFPVCLTPDYEPDVQNFVKIGEFRNVSNGPQPGPLKLVVLF
jgi:hypothetical protein